MARNSTHMKLRVSVLTVALLSVYGMAGAQGIPEEKWLLCTSSTCTPDSTDYFGVDHLAEHRPANKTFLWVVKGEDATFTLKDAKVTANGHRTRGVGSTADSNITLNNVAVTTV